MNFEQITRNLNNDVYENVKEYPSTLNAKYKKLKPDYVFDENLSVKENREMVKKHNEEIQNYTIEYYKETERVRELFHNDVVQALQDVYSFNKETSEKIYSKAYSDEHSSGRYAVSIRAEEYADFLEEVLQLQK